MMWFTIILVLALLSQVGLFLYSRKVKSRFKEGVIEKYQLRTPKDAWDALANPEVPEEDKKEIKRLYDGEE
ncbi:MAG: hypothetical protein DRI71_03670 [Bacteroidetes bacterium]|nr:MAG: hypothetical protein DRI71_03670 [Bacteroidota bacterium]